MPRPLAIALLVLAALAALGEWRGLELPSAGWFFSFGSVAGWTLCALMAAAGAYGLVRGRSYRWNPVTVQRFRRFRQIRRGYVSFLILMGLVALALLDHAIVGKRALAVSHEGRLYFPAFIKERYPGTYFGLDHDSETDYRDLKRRFREEDTGGWVLLPLVPWDPVLDSDDGQRVELVEREGLYHRPGQKHPYSGRAYRYHEANPEQAHSEWRFRRGRPDGDMEGWTDSGENAVRASWRTGAEVAAEWSGAISEADFAAAPATPYTALLYPPLPPMWKAGHFLGTDSRGWDILAQLYGGWQVNLKAAFIYILATYGVGIAIGSLMGFFGSWFDLLFQRVIEILENQPFLYIIIIITSVIGVQNMNLPILLGVICVFSWTGLTYYLRTATYKEKSRDYVAAARLAGASTPRILRRHILPNTIATIVTFVPFSVAGIIYSLTALSFIGFGLPERYPSWGWLLDDGISYLSAPWIVGSVFAAMVSILILVTFVGEALREAFDPKKFTTYE